MYSVYQHWDPLRVCVVGQSYPPEFYSWITVPRVRELFERIATETEEDYQSLIKVLKRFNVDVIRPTIATREESWVNNGYLVPPMQPRNHLAMIGNTLHQNIVAPWQDFYSAVADPSWPDLPFDKLPSSIQQECIAHGYRDLERRNQPWEAILENCRPHVANIEFANDMSEIINGAMVTRIGRDLYFSTENYNQDITELQYKIDSKFPDTRNHIINTGGHGDGVYCPVAPGLIISTHDVNNYDDSFPGWEVIRVPNTNWNRIRNWMDLANQNRGRWWIPGHETDQDVIDTVENWMSHWTGYVEETVFDVNMLIIDPKNVIVGMENDTVFKALDRYGITPHVVEFRHRWFWDGGIHCMTSDLHREGSQQDFFSGCR